MGSVYLLLNEAGPKVRASLLVGRAWNSGTGACPLVGGAGSYNLWLLSSVAPVHCCVRPGPLVDKPVSREAVDSKDLKAAYH